jgi:hypothetical protein
MKIKRPLSDPHCNCEIIGQWFVSIRIMFNHPQSIQSARLSLRSSELALPAPSSAGELLGVAPPPPLAPRGEGTHSLEGEGVGGANSDEKTDTLVVL